MVNKELGQAAGRERAMSMSPQEIQQALNDAPVNWYHKFEIIPGSGVYTPGIVETGNYAPRMEVMEVDPAFFKGKRVLDIGALTGAFTFLMEDLGAEAVALDVEDPERNGFNLVHKLRNSKVKHIRASVYDLSPADFGEFDVVCFFGVWYHLKHPLLAFERINTVTKMGGMLLAAGASSQRWFHDDRDDTGMIGADFAEISRDNLKNKEAMTVNDLNDLPLIGFAPTQYLRDQTNWMLPNERAALGWLEVSGFEVQRSHLYTSRHKRDWNDQGVTITNHNVKAIKTGDYTREYPLSYTYMQPFEIPTQLEVERLRREIADLQAQLAAKE